MLNTLQLVKFTTAWDWYRKHRIAVPVSNFPHGKSKIYFAIDEANASHNASRLGLRLNVSAYYNHRDNRILLSSAIISQPSKAPVRKVIYAFKLFEQTRQLNTGVLSISSLFIDLFLPNTKECAPVPHQVT